MTRDDAFLAAIMDTPDDDAPRLVYADWLEENGRPERADFIRIQCQLASLPEGDVRRPELEARESDLLQWYCDAWLEPFGDLADFAQFRRGFVWGLAVAAEDFVDRAEAVFRMAPVQHADLYFDSPDMVVRLSEMVCLERLSSLRLKSDLAPRLWGPLFRSKHLVNLTALDLYDNRIRNLGLQDLADSHQMVRLRELRLGWNGIGTRGIRALAASPLLSHLTDLNLVFNEIGRQGAVALASSPFAASLTHLDLHGNMIDDIGGRALAESPHLAKLIRLDLQDNRIGEETRQLLLARFDSQVQC